MIEALGQAGLDVAAAGLGCLSASLRGLFQPAKTDGVATAKRAGRTLLAASFTVAVTAMAITPTRFWIRAVGGGCFAVAGLLGAACDLCPALVASRP